MNILVACEESQVVVEQPFCPSCTSRKIKAAYGAAKRGNDSINRSKTFLGVAQAMAAQWSFY